MKSVILRTLSVLFLSFFAVQAWGAESKLVDVDKDSKLSDYFKKINKKVTDDSEDKLLPEKAEEATASTTALPEEEIPLTSSLEDEKKAPEMASLNKMVLAIFVLLIMMAGSYTLLQRMGKKKGYSQIAKNITVLTQKPLGQKKSLMLIRVAGETILLGVTDHNINHIKTLSLIEDELPEYTEPQFSKSLQNKIATSQEPIDPQPTKEEVDGFSVSRLDDVKKAVTERFRV